MKSRVLHLQVQGLHLQSDPHLHASFSATKVSPEASNWEFIAGATPRINVSVVVVSPENPKSGYILQLHKSKFCVKIKEKKIKTERFWQNIVKISSKIRDFRKQIFSRNRDFPEKIVDKKKKKTRDFEDLPSASNALAARSATTVSTTARNLL